MLFGTKKEREFIVEERDVTTVLSVINRRLKYCQHFVDNCGWKNEPTKWFVMFDATDKAYKDIISELKNVGNFNVDIRPGGQMDICFERALT